ncbi:hypothetical protein SAMN05518672_103446 [Chitinophaga sp. CF118]|nr:hypothetical protein SAMN05518672_103446 [Chitinophaga sp. CF118]
MIFRSNVTRKRLACFFLTLLIVQGLMPTVAWALTSGPTQPETKQFMQAGTSDMVNLSTGDFKYNIPLMDVDGYPVNLNYQGGTGIDDEAGWVGLGWNLNAGAINRQLRGIPDDSYGDEVVTNSYMKPKINIGGRVTVRGELTGIGVSGSLSLGIFSDNYTGIGAEVGANVGLSLSGQNGGGLTPGIGIGLNSNTSDGVTVTPSASLSMKAQMNNHLSSSMGLSASLGYNTREGLKALSLGSSFSLQGYDNDYLDQGSSSGSSLGGTSISYNTPPFYPRTNMAFKSSNFTFSVDIGGEAMGMYMGGGVTGYKSKREVLNEEVRNKTFGFMYAEKGKDVRSAMMDFMREKDNPVIPELKNLALPIATPDIFSYTSQAGSGQLKLYRNSAGVLFDNETKDITNNTSIGTDYGWGGYFHGGVSVYKQEVTNTNGKWITDNNFLAHGDFVTKGTVEEEPAYFKQVGEKNMENASFVTRIQDENAISVPLTDKSANDEIKTAGQKIITPTAPYKKDGRQVKRTPIMVLTADQATNAGLDKQIRNYQFNDLKSFSPVACNLVPSVVPEDRVTAFRKAKHISEMTVTGDDGKRMVYGLPVYNKMQDEYSFAVNGETADRNTNLIDFSAPGGKIDHKPMKNGVSTTDEYYHKESQPAYASAFLLTGILSPDYVDVTGDGITDDDRGTAVKFNYSKLAKDFHWRSPYGAYKAQYNHALNADPDDDKASFVYGEKELWYMHSIESKTKIAYFITEDREDALGCNWLGVKDGSVKQKVLRKIILYSKNDLTTPIKTVILDYNYSLCPKIPNSSNGGGKLTLIGLHFEYGSSTKGSKNPYTFKYNTEITPGVIQEYGYLSADRWGTFKSTTDNAARGFGVLKNDEFPYSTGDSILAAKNAGMWNLSEVHLPTGGIINIHYESDDYAYVQNRRAMEMVKIDNLLDKDGNVTSSLRDAVKFKLTLGETAPDFDQTNWFKLQYLNGESWMYAKLFVNLTNEVTATSDDKYDFVACYGAIDKVEITGKTAIVTFKTSSEATAGANPFVNFNPFVSAAWQKMRLEYPRYAYPGYKNRINDDRPIAAAVTAIANATGNLSELRENFNARAYRKKFASNVKLDKSFVRIVKRGTPEQTGGTPRNGDMPKLGGGARVKSIQLSDNWNAMASDQATVTYGQEYEYDMLEDGKWISSGVASYEPSLGGDENPMRLPVNYTQDVKWALNNFFYLEEPMGESLFPAPEVVYREVKVRSLDATGAADKANKTGWLTYEFYTAKEFPVVINQTPLDKYLHHPTSWSSFFGGKTLYELVMSQGYAITLNDMHGKPKAERVFNQTGQEISSSEYFYNSTEEGGIQRLKNVVDVVDDNGVITKDQVIGRDIEMFTDMRQSEMINSGKSINLGVDVIPIGPWIIPIPHFPWSNNDDYRLFRSASVLKTIQYYGLISKVVKKINGSSVSAANLLYDKFTGEPVLSQSNNEFDDPVYSLSMPAYWMYKQMGPAYKSLGLLLSDFTTTIDGIPEKGYGSFLTAGDELIDVSNGMRLWVVNSPAGSSPVNVLRIIDASGKVAIKYAGSVKVRRSGYRNLLTAGATAITTLKNPVSNNQLKPIINDFGDYKALNASAIEYNNAWGQPADCNLKSCPEGYQEGADGRCYLPATRVENDSFNIIEGDVDEKYSSQGAAFFEETGNVSYFTSTSGFWRKSGDHPGRLEDAGIWMNKVADNSWWGFEKCITIKTDGTYFIGYAGDDRMRVFVDGFVLDALTASDGNYFSSWRIRKKQLTAGKHIIKIVALNIELAKAAALEVYGSSEATLVAGDEATIRSQTIFTTASLFAKQPEDIVDANVLIFHAEELGTKLSQNLRCPEGKSVGICDGTPDCGFKDKGSCPDGYKPGADGTSCVPIESGESDANPDLDFVEGSFSGFYTQNGTRFFSVDGSQQSIFNLATSYWGQCRSSIPLSLLARKATVDTPKLAAKSLSVAVSDPANANCGILNAIGVWLGGGFMHQWIGVHTCLKVPQTKLYYIGLGFDNIGRIYIDGTRWYPPVTIPADLTYTLWPIQLTAGNHDLTIEAMNTGTEYGFAVEVYNDSLSTLKQGIAHPIYSTRDLRGATSYFTYVKDTAGNIIRQSYACAEGSFDVCSSSGTCGAIPNSVTLNPYLTGYLGNWLPWKQMTWLSNRSGQALPVTSTPGVDVRHNGQYDYFYPYWIYNNGWAISGNLSWVVSQTISLYDKNSQELENKDALNRYSAVRYGYKATLPVAVGANMRHQEIFYDGFEDYKFNNTCTGAQPCEPDEFSIYKILGSDYTNRLDATDAHSGNYSLNLSQPLNLKTYVFDYEHSPGIYLINNQKGEYSRNVVPWLGLRGFCPVNGRRYVFSAWVKDGAPLTDDPGIKLMMGTEDNVVFTVKAVVEDWKLVEGVIDIAALAGTTEMYELNATLEKQAGTVLIDDIRIFPYDGQLKTFSYDDKTLRLMAEMDENNYATFYEYDDEGSLVRVKKETDRGIMTIKENRSAYRKN